MTYTKDFNYLHIVRDFTGAKQVAIKLIKFPNWILRYGATVLKIRIIKENEKQ